MKHFPSIEALESRIAPAILLTLASGVLTITGGAGAEDISIEAPEAANSNLLTLTANSGGPFQLNGQTFTAFDSAQSASITKIAINLGNGANQVAFTGTSFGDGFSQAISFTGGIDSDTLILSGVHSTSGLSANLGAGDDTVDFLSNAYGEVFFAGNVSFNLGAGNNQITTTLVGGTTATPDFEFQGSLTITGGDGNDSVTIGADADLDSEVTIGKAFTFNAGKGANNFTLFGTEVTLGKVTLKSTDTVAAFPVSITSIANFSLNGGLTVAAPGLGNTFDLEAPSLKISGGISYKGGAGADTVNIGNLSTSVVALIGGKVSIANGEGTNITNFGQSGSPGTLKIGGSVSVSGGTGSDSLAIFGTGSISGGISAMFGKGNSTTNITSSSLFVGGLTLKAADTLTATDSLTLQGVYFTKAVSLNLGAGASTVTIDDILALDKFSLNSGAGADIINIETNTLLTGLSDFFGAASINSGLGTDTINIGDSVTATKTRAFFLSSLTIDAGAALDGDHINGIDTTSNPTDTVAAAMSAIVSDNTFLPGSSPTIKHLV